MSLYDYSVRTIEGQTTSLSEFKGKVLLIVNTASKCGFTPQYEGLETLQKTYGPKGFSVLGFPCNQFGGQEPGAEAEIASFCSLTYDVTFPMFGKIDVNGPKADPLFAYLKDEKKGLLGSAPIKWNFTKFLIGADGVVAERYSPMTKPEEIAPAIEGLLAKAG
jgi:glutathione peroxidase